MADESRRYETLDELGLVRLQDHYALLGVMRDATLDDIKKAYRKWSMRYHPDHFKKQPWDELSDFKLIQEAYDALSDYEKRKRYDELLGNRVYAPRKREISGLLGAGKGGGKARLEHVLIRRYTESGDSIESLWIIDDGYDWLEKAVGIGWDELKNKGYSDLEKSEWFKLCSEGERLYVQGNTESALSCFDNMLSLAPDNIIGLYRKALILENLSSLSDALELYLAALKNLRANYSAGRGITIYQSLGRVYHKLNDKNKTKVMYEKVLLLNPHSIEAREVLEILNGHEACDKNALPDAPKKRLLLQFFGKK